MNRELDKKTEIKLANFALQNSYAYGTKEYQSSAKDLQNELLARGITDIKVYYEYKMPGGLSQADYMIKMSWYDFFAIFDNVSKIPMFQKDFNICFDDETERAQVVDYIKSHSEMYKEKLKKDCEDLIKLNPELLVITDKVTHCGDILWGAVFGEMPDNIEYYCNGRYYPSFDINMAKQGAIAQRFRDYGLQASPGIWDPNRAEELFSVLERNAGKDIIKKNETVREIR